MLCILGEKTQMFGDNMQSPGYARKPCNDEHAWVPGDGTSNNDVHSMVPGDSTSSSDAHPTAAEISTRSSYSHAMVPEDKIISSYVHVIRILVAVMSMQ